MKSLSFPSLTLSSVTKAFKEIGHIYEDSTPVRGKLIDCYLLFIVATGVLQMAYYAAIGSTYPFNSLLSALLSCAGCFVLAVSLRLQCVDADSSVDFAFSQERAFADFVIGHIILHFAVISFLG